MKKPIIQVVLSAAVWLPIPPVGPPLSRALPAQPHVTLTGMVSCRQCKKIHPDHGWTNSSCTLRCVRDGSDFVLVVGKEMFGNNVYKLEGDRKLFEKLAGGTAIFLGHFESSGDEFYVENVETKRK